MSSFGFNEYVSVEEQRNGTKKQLKAEEEESRHSANCNKRRKLYPPGGESHGMTILKAIPTIQTAWPGAQLYSARSGARPSDRFGKSIRACTGQRKSPV
jgi:hypothetical protein